MKYILSFDQGTTSSRSIIFDHSGAIKSVAQREFRQIFPRPGWVEHDAEEIWKTQISTAREAMDNAGIGAGDIAAIGITNQRETTVVWDRESGAPIYNAIVWQDRRTAAFCKQLKEDGAEAMARERSGLVLDPYFSGTKVRWVLDNVDGARSLAEQGRLAFGTIDSWLIWNLTGGRRHVTDSSNASRTLLFNINTLEWDDDMLALLDVPASVLPEVGGSSEVLAETLPALFGKAIPIGGVAGDQQAALFGQVCTEPGMAKNTYGTGCFMLMNTGGEPVTSENNLLTTVAWTVDGKTDYALEGSVFVGGAVVQWLRDGLGIIKASEEVEALARSVDSTDGVFFVPAFTGLGAPHWDPYARGSIFGLTRGSTSAHIARAALESIAYQSADVIRAMEGDSGISLRELRVDGGAAANNLLMQFQSDLLQVPVIRPRVLETTALGAAYLAGLSTGYWKDTEELATQWQQDRKFESARSASDMESLVTGWNAALERSKQWETSDTSTENES